MGLFNFNKNKSDKAKKEDKTDTQNLAESAAWYSKASQCLKFGQYAGALECFAKASECDPQNPAILHEMGRVYAILKKQDESLKCYDDAIRLRPNSAVYYHNKGDALASFERYEEADECFKKALELSPDEVIYLSSRALVLAKSKKYREAEEIMKTVCEKEPLEAEHWFNRASYLYDAEEFESAAAFFRAAVEIYPRHSVSHFNCGNCLSKLKRYEEAVFHYDKALKYEKTMTGAMNNKGLALSCLGDHLGACECFKRVLMALPNDADVRYNLGYELFMLERYEEAVSTFDIALSVADDNNRELIDKAREKKAEAISKMKS